MITRYLQKMKEYRKLTQTIIMYSQNIGIKFGSDKCAMLIMKSGERELPEGIQLPNQKNIKTLGEKENCKYLGILEVNTIKQVEMKEKIKKNTSEE